MLHCFPYGLTSRKGAGLAFLSLGLLFMVAMPAHGRDVAAQSIYVPDDAPTLQAAVDLASSGDEIVVRGPDTYAGHVIIDGTRLAELRIRGFDAASPPALTATFADSAIVLVVAEGLERLDVRFEDLVLDGLGTASYGIRLPGRAPGAETSVTLHGVTIRDCIIGAQIGDRCGTYNCHGEWGGIDYACLKQGETRVSIKNCLIHGVTEDALNLYRITGEISENFIAGNGDEACHLTRPRRLEMRHNVIIKNRGNGIHLQMGAGCIIQNNMIANTRRRDDRGGSGVLIGGSTGAASVLTNNLIKDNAGAGIRIQPAQVVVNPFRCEPVGASGTIINNILDGNGWHSEDLFEIHIADQGISGHVMANNLITATAAPPSNEELAQSNIVSDDPAYTANPSYSEFFMAGSVAEAMVIGRGWALSSASPAIDIGVGGLAFHDVSPLSQGTSRNDAGAFGGPGGDWPFSSATGQGESSCD